MKLTALHEVEPLTFIGGKAKMNSCFVVIFIHLWLFFVASVHASPRLYTGTLEVSNVSGKACTGKEIKEQRQISLVLDQSGNTLTGLFSGRDMATGKFSGVIADQLPVTYPFFDKNLASGHTLSLSFSDDTISGVLHERHLDNTVDACNWDNAVLHFSLSAESAPESLTRMQKLYDAQEANSEGVHYLGIREYEKATAPLTKALALREEAEGKLSPDVAVYLNRLVIAYGRNKEFDKAITLLEPRMATFGGNEGTSLHATQYWLLEGKADMRRENGNYAGAIPLYQQLIQARNGDSTRPGVEKELNDLTGKLAECQFRAGKLVEAEETYKQLFAVKEKNWSIKRVFQACPDVSESDPTKALGRYVSGYAPQDDYSRRTAQCYFQKYAGRYSYSLSDKVVAEIPELAILIMMTESMDQKEKQYWFDILPSMTTEQTSRLYRILSVETKRLQDLENNYASELAALNEKHLLEWNLLRLANEHENTKLIELIETTSLPDNPSLSILQAGVHRMRKQLPEAAEKLERAVRIVERTTGLRTAEGLIALYNLAIVRLEQGNYQEFKRLVQENDLSDYPAYDPKSAAVHHLKNTNIWLNDNENINAFYTGEMKSFGSADERVLEMAALLKEMVVAFTDAKMKSEEKKQKLYALRRKLIDSGAAKRVATSRLVVNRGCEGPQVSAWSGKEEYATVRGNSVSLCSREGDRLIIAVANPLPVTSATFDKGVLKVTSNEIIYDYDPFTGRTLRIQKKMEAKASRSATSSPPTDKPRITALADNKLAAALGRTITLHTLSPLSTATVDLSKECQSDIKELKASGHNLLAVCGSALVSVDMDGSMPIKAAMIPVGKTRFISSPSGHIYLYSQEASKIFEYSPVELSVIAAIDTTGFQIEKDQSVVYADTKRTLVVQDGGLNVGVITMFPAEIGEKVTVFDDHFEPVRMVDVRGDLVASITAREVKLWSLASGRSFWSRAVNNPSLIKIIGNTVLIASDSGRISQLYLYTGEELREFKGHDGPLIGLTVDIAKTLTLGADGSVKIWRPELFSATAGDLKSDREICTVLFTSGRDWIVIDREGRFDSNNLEEVKGLHWVMPDDPLKPLPFETFMKDYYEPRLLNRLLDGEQLKPVRALHDLNRVQPEVKISSVQNNGEGDTVTVQVEVARGMHNYRRDGTQVFVTSGVKDVKLFRDGRLVAFREGQVDLDRTSGKAIISFSNIRIPRKVGDAEVEFSAYAFNDDGIKSQTSRKAFTIPLGLGSSRGKAYLVTIGVNRHQNPAWELSYAASDAASIRQALETHIPRLNGYSELVSVTLIDENATKENIKAVLDLLSGKKVLSTIKKRIPHADSIGKATPEDLLFVSFSGHGFVDGAGVFHALPHDTGSGTDRAITSSLLSHSITSEELSEWLRDVDAGDMAMIVDACHSAATVGGDGFKPGPMGSRGLGQLAYDKGMRILAATQADNVALESDTLRQGLLSYALVRDGMDSFKADYMPKDNLITLGEWLNYGVERVPDLYQEVRSGSIKGVITGDSGQVSEMTSTDMIEELRNRKQHYQTPALFDFTRRHQRDVPLADRRGER